MTKKYDYSYCSRIIKQYLKVRVKGKYNRRKTMTKACMTKFLKCLSMTISSMTKNLWIFQVWQKKVWPQKIIFLGYDYYIPKETWKSMKKKPMG